MASRELRYSDRALERIDTFMESQDSRKFNSFFDRLEDLRGRNLEPGHHSWQGDGYKALIEVDEDGKITVLSIWKI